MSSRRMAYPITLGAKLVHFPYKLYYEKSWPVKPFLISLFIMVPVFYYIQKLSYSPGNLKKYEQYKKKLEDEHKHHLEHLY